jgi:aminopeptidase N
MYRTRSAPAVLLKNYRKPDYLIDTVDLDFKLHRAETLVTARISFRRSRGTKIGTPLILDGDDLHLLSARLDGAPLDARQYRVQPDRFTLNHPPKSFTLELVTRVNPQANTALSGLYRSGGNYCTQCEAEGFRRITYFLDRPDVLAVYTVRLEADLDEAPVLLSNGNPGKSGALDDNRHYAIWHDPHPKPSYLFALVAGDLGSFQQDFLTSEGRKVRLGIYVQKGKEARAHYAMDALVRSMRWDEQVFGCAYDLDVFNIVAVPDFNMGAMENKGLNIFNDKYILADQDTATDADFSQIETIVAHEYFHNWTGNRITCRDWFQLCLKEGLTVYRDQEFSSDMRSRPVKRIQDVALLRARQFPEDAGPLAHAVRPESYREINNFYTATIYEKGAELVRMIATLLGEKKFAAGMRRYLKMHDGEAATIEQFIHCFEVAGRMDLSQFFNWYRQAGTPHLHVSCKYDADKRTFEIEIEQSTPPTQGQTTKKPLLIPLRIGLIGLKSSKELKAARFTGAEHAGDVFHITQRRHKLVFHGVDEHPVASINRNFSAPIIIDYRQSDRDLIFLAKHDSDPFNRWQAFRTMAIRQILSAMRAISRKKKPAWNKAFLEAAVDIAGDDTVEPAFRAMMLTLPSEADLGQAVGRNIDPDAIHAARKALFSALGEILEPERERISAGLTPLPSYDPAASEAGKRDLANLLLAYGLNANSEKAEEAIKRQFKQADNMSDREASFRAIVCEINEPRLSATALSAFYKRYRDDPIVLDKWFTVQVLVPGREGLKNARDLIRHKDFSWTNPNRLRSVIGAFSAGNPTGFNLKDGSGYRFVCEAIAHLDPVNPQVAARLLTNFRSLAMLEPQRRKLSVAPLQSLRKAKQLSRDVSEILDRILAEV